MIGQIKLEDKRIFLTDIETGNMLMDIIFVGSTSNLTHMDGWMQHIDGKIVNYEENEAFVEVSEIYGDCIPEQILENRIEELKQEELNFIVKTESKIDNLKIFNDKNKATPTNIPTIYYARLNDYTVKVTYGKKLFIIITKSDEEAIKVIRNKFKESIHSDVVELEIEKLSKYNTDNFVFHAETIYAEAYNHMGEE